MVQVIWYQLIRCLRTCITRATSCWTQVGMSVWMASAGNAVFWLYKRHIDVTFVWCISELKVRSVVYCTGKLLESISGWADRWRHHFSPSVETFPVDEVLRAWPDFESTCDMLELASKIRLTWPMIKRALGWVTATTSKTIVKEQYSEKGTLLFPVLNRLTPDISIGWFILAGPMDECPGPSGWQEYQLPPGSKANGLGKLLTDGQL